MRQMQSKWRSFGSAENKMYRKNKEEKKRKGKINELILWQRKSRETKIECSKKIKSLFLKAF